MKKFGQLLFKAWRGLDSTLRFLAALSFLAFICWLTYKAAHGAGRFILSLNSDVAKAIVAAAATGLFSVLVVIFSKTFEHRATLKRELREKKIPVYEEMMKLFFEMIYAPKIQQGQIPNDVKNRLTKFVPTLVVWGSDDVTKAFSDFRSLTTKTNLPNFGQLMAFAICHLILVLRKDLGHQNRGILPHNLLQIFINDPIMALYAKPDQIKNETKAVNEAR